MPAMCCSSSSTCWRFQSSCCVVVEILILTSAAAAENSAGGCHAVRRGPKNRDQVRFGVILVVAKNARADAFAGQA